MTSVGGEATIKLSLYHFRHGDSEEIYIILCTGLFVQMAESYRTHTLKKTGDIIIQNLMTAEPTAQTFRPACVWRKGGEAAREKANDASFLPPSLFVLFREFNQNKQQTHLCQSSAYGKTNITWFRLIMMPQRRPCSPAQQLGQHESSECERTILTGKTESRPQISRLVPGEKLSGESTPPSDQQQTLRLEKHTCHRRRVTERRGRRACAHRWMFYLPT